MTRGPVKLVGKTLKSRIFLIVSLAVSIVIGAGAFVNFMIVRYEFNRNIERNIHYTFNMHLDRLNGIVRQMQTHGLALARAGEMLYGVYRTNGIAGMTGVFEGLVSARVSDIPMILGSGLWFEPYRFGPSIRYFGPYAFWKQGSVRTTWEYNSPGYDYHTREWYRIALSGRPSGVTASGRSVYMTAPYNDTLEGRPTVFITMAIPMFDGGGRFLGVSTTDWGIDVIRNNLKDFYLTRNSFIMLVDRRSGMVLYHPDQGLVMRPFSSIAWSSHLPEVLSGNIGERDYRGIRINGVPHNVISANTEGDFVLIVAVPPREAYSRITAIMVAMSCVSVLFMVFVVFILTRLFNRYFVRRVVRISEGIGMIESGSYPVDIHFDEDDELSRIADDIGKMSMTIRNREQDLVNLQLYLSNIIESMPSILISLDESGVIRRWNRSAAEHFAIPAGRAIGEKFWSQLPEFARYEDCFRRVIEEGAPIVLQREAVMLDTVRYYSISIFPLLSDDQKGVVFHIDDITDIERKEQQLRQAQKLETIGMLAGGFAHDFNNVLAGIIGTVSLLKYKMSENIPFDNKSLGEMIEIIDSSSKRATAIVQQLLTLSRKHEVALVPVDINDAVRHVIDVCANSFDKSVEFAVGYSDRPAMISADPAQIEQVLLNLFVNGYHAMTIMRAEGEKRGGTLSVALRTVSADRQFCAGQPEAEEGVVYWEISVADTGVGLDQELLSKIFDPFFTTKKKYSGTGLGLTMSYNIIKQHRGFISVRSMPGKGTMFLVYLPALAEVKPDLSGAAKGAIRKGEGRILIIDDEEGVRTTAETMLQVCGYETISAETGEEGVELYRRNRDSIRAVLLDMVMPKQSGRDIFIALKEIDPEVHVVLTSGYGEDERIEEMRQLGIREFLMKPFTIERLSEVMGSITGRPRDNR